jgi:sugar phosphate permease
MAFSNNPGRVDRRWLILIPVASLMYLVAYVDRTNISFILPFIGHDLHLTGADKGSLSGIFFVGYLVLQVPAAVLARRWSAKNTILVLMVLWGATAVLSGLVQTKEELFAARFALGVFEGGVQPATLVLLAAWFSQRQRARANGLWLVCLPLSALIASPLTGILLAHVDWRTVLVIEGLPPFVCAAIWLLLISDNPRLARWMPADAARRVIAELASDEARPKAVPSARYRDVLRNPKVWGLIAFWFLFNSGFYGFTLWLPTVVSGLSRGSSVLVGWLTAIPYLLALAGMIIIAVIADRTGSRRWVIVVPVLISAAGLLAGQFVGNPALRFVILCVVAGTLYIHGPFLAVPAVLLRVEVLALGFGVINGIGNLGGFVGPYVFGALLDSTHSTKIGFFAIAGVFVLASAVLLVVVPRTRHGQPTRTAPVEMSEQAIP